MIEIVPLLVLPLASAWFVTFKIAGQLTPGEKRPFSSYILLAGAHLVVAVVMSFVTLIGADVLGAFSQSPDTGMAAGIGMVMCGTPALLLSCTTQLILLSTKTPG